MDKFCYSKLGLQEQINIAYIERLIHAIHCFLRRQESVYATSGSFGLRQETIKGIEHSLDWSSASPYKKLAVYLDCFIKRYPQVASKLIYDLVILPSLQSQK